MFCITQQTIAVELALKQWTKQFGTPRNDSASEIITDSLGNIYIGGNTYGGIGSNVNVGDSDLFLTKYNSSGTIQWTKQFGTSGADYSCNIALDSMSNIYATGRICGELDGNVYAGNGDVFLTKYDSLGNRQWTKQFGTSALEYGLGVAVDSINNIYVTGYTAGGLDGNVNNGVEDIFLAKYDSSGNKFWIKQIGTQGGDIANGITIDDLDNIYITGYTTDKLDSNTSYGYADAFLIKFSSSGDKQFVKQFGTSGHDRGIDIATDKLGNIYITGSTSGNLSGNNYGKEDIFLIKFDSSGTIHWTKQIGTAETDEGYGITLNDSGNVYVTGITYGGLDGNSNLGNSDIFFISYDTLGNKQWTKQFGTTNEDCGNDIGLDNSSNIYISGYTRGGIDGNNNSGGQDCFFMKYKLFPNNNPILSWTGEPNYISDGINPNIGDNTTIFNFRTKYTDIDSDAPKSNYPKVHILKNGVEIYSSPFTMNLVGSTSPTTGDIYSYSTILSTGVDYSYYFEAYDIWNATATGVTTLLSTGPVVLSLDRYEIIVPTTNTLTGSVFDVIVNAKNSNNDTLTNYSGNITIQTILSSDESLAGSGVLGVTNATLTNGTVTIPNQTYMRAENIKLKVTDNNNKTGVSNTITVLPSYNISMTITANPMSVINGQQTTVAVELKDYYNNPVSGVNVTFDIVKGSGTLSSATVTTDNTGKSVVTFTPNISGSGESIIRATSGSLLPVEIKINVSVLVVASDGGIVISADDPNTKLSIPAGTLTRDAWVNIYMKQGIGLGEGQQYEIIAKEKDSEFNITDLDKNVDLTLHYRVNSDGKVANTDVLSSSAGDNLGLYYHDGVSWQKVNSVVDINNQTIVAKVNKLGLYAIRCQTSKSSSFRFSGIGPNPFTPNPDGVYDRVYFYFDNPENKDVELKIFDLGGTFVRNVEITPGVVPYWDGRNTGGMLVEGGMYLYSLRVGNETVKGTIVLGK